MKKEFEKTPSFFNDEDTFNKYLGQTSYYIGLQKNVNKLVKMINPKSVLELGSATGATTLMLAKEYAHIKFDGIDMRKDVVEISNLQAKSKSLNNANFMVGNMLDIAKNKIESELIILLYSFHHIPDPLTEKISFLKNLYDNISDGSYVCIAETFLPGKGDAYVSSKEILDLWNARKDEGYASTFWSSLSSISKDDILNSCKIAEYCSKNEYFAGELVSKREDEYLVKSKWLIDNALNIGYEVIINQPINIIEDRIVLLRK